MEVHNKAIKLNELPIQTNHFTFTQDYGIQTRLLHSKADFLINVKFYMSCCKKVSLFYTLV